MAFGRKEGLYYENGQEILKYSIAIEYLLIRLKYFHSELTIGKLNEILNNISIDDIVMKYLDEKIKAIKD